jgi:hypothetical protein
MYVAGAGPKRSVEILRSCSVNWVPGARAAFGNSVWVSERSRERPPLHVKRLHIVAELRAQVARRLLGHRDCRRRPYEHQEGT